MTAAEAKIKQIVNELEGRLTVDNGIPRNIRKGASDAVSRLQDVSKPIDLRVSNAISVLGDLSNDPNIPMETWSAIMQILSELEVILREL